MALVERVTRSHAPLTEYRDQKWTVCFPCPKTAAPGPPRRVRHEAHLAPASRRCGCPRELGVTLREQLERQNLRRTHRWSTSVSVPRCSSLKAALLTVGALV
jgi:hypothetical protein